MKRRDGDGWARRLKATYERVDYRFDELMAGGAKPLAWLLVTATVALVLVVSAVLVVTEESQVGFGDQVYRSLHPVFPGLFGGQNGSPAYMIAMVLLAIFGLLLVSVLVGTITARINRFLVDLARGKSHVVEHDHVVILGWTEEVYAIVEQLALAASQRRREAIVILADRDKLEMESLIRQRVPLARRVRVICRTGSVIDSGDIAIINPSDARALIVLPSEGRESDAQVIKTILAINNIPAGPQTRPSKKSVRPLIVAEIQDPENLQIARIAAGQDRFAPIDLDEIVSQLIVQTIQQPGLRHVYEHLLTFAGSEFYELRDHGLDGCRFADALTKWERLVPVGIREAGRITVRPSPDFRLSSRSELLVLAEDDDAVKAQQPAAAEDDDVPRAYVPKVSTPTPVDVLILGSNRRTARILAELDKSAAPESKVSVACVEAAADGVKAAVDRLRTAAADKAIGNPHLTIEMVTAAPESRSALNEILERHFDTVVVLAEDGLNRQHSDARTLMTLLHVRDLKHRQKQRFTVVTEILDDRNAKLAEGTEGDDFIVRGKLVSYLVSQVAKEQWRTTLFRTLLAAGGPMIELHPAADYAELGRETTFHAITLAAAEHGEVALGYVDQPPPAEPPKIVLNPPKSHRRTLSEHDLIVVLTPTYSGRMSRTNPTDGLLRAAVTAGGQTPSSSA